MIKSLIRMLMAGMLCFACQSANQRQVLYYINSYHPGYPPSDAILRGICREVDTTEVCLVVQYLDAKRERRTGHLDSLARLIAGEIHRLKPSAVLVSDDDAVARVVLPYLLGGSTPVVFCGVNWSAAGYGLPDQNVCGMLEVLPLQRALADLGRHYPDASRLYVLSENTLSEQQNRILLDTLYRNAGFQPEYHLVDHYAGWKAGFAEANDQAGLLYLPTNGGILDWDSLDAIAFVRDHLRIPVFTCDGFMMPYAVAGYLKVPEEQGIWVGRTALRILEGTAPREIGLHRNSEYEIQCNPVLAGIIGFRPTAKGTDSGSGSN
jgi:ABC-type uncharacterized transport system substrate-binding protein